MTIFIKKAISVFRLKLKINRYYFYLLIYFALICLSANYFVLKANAQSIFIAEEKIQSENIQIISLLNKYSQLSSEIKKNKVSLPNINLATEEQTLKELKALIDSSKLTAALSTYDSLIDALNKKVNIEQAKGILTGKVTINLPATPPSTSPVIKIYQGESEVAQIVTTIDTSYNYWLAPGKYVLKANLTGYQEYVKEIEIVTAQTIDLPIVLQLIPPVVVQAPQPVASTTPKPKPSASVSPKPSTTPTTVSDGVYSKETVVTSRGNFTVHLLKIDLNLYTMKVETAADGNCENNCPVKSLSSYANQHNAIAGIHGTYFCPTAYADCANKTNSFYYKLYNSRLNAQINWDNKLGELLPFLAIDKSGNAHFYYTWQAAMNEEMSAGISCRPHLVEKGEIVLTDSDMDSDKEKTFKMTHGFIGLKGQIVYAGIVLAANLPDSAAVVKALGIDDAFNIDGGGTSAMYYNGAYKVGPGRDMPNAVVFVKK